jgi:hypothetical protein
VDYVLHDGVLSALLVRREGVEAALRIASERELRSLTHRLLFALRSAAWRPAAERGEDPALSAVLEELASRVLWPALGRAGLPARLAVVPAGPLARLPWAALPLPDGRALCEAIPATVVPGLRLTSAASRRAAGGPPLVVAVDSGDLEGVGAETEAVRAAFPGARLLRGAEATAERFQALARDAAWIHFAGHGIYVADAPYQSGLRLADRWLVADEITGSRLAARWVTLSACQTARALVRPGEEWFGLARTLLLSGAEAVLASQWDIEDHAAVRLMERTYRHLAAGVPLAGSLGRAQAERRAEGAHPIEWAGFVMLTGPGRELGRDAGFTAGTEPESGILPGLRED